MRKRRKMKTKTYATGLTIIISALMFIFYGNSFAQPNILVIIGDDMGVETLKSYGVTSNTPQTKNLDSLAANGVSFDNFWSQPVCSPTRATILTGRYGFRTGVGQPVGRNDGPKPPVLTAPDWAHAEAHPPKKRKRPPRTNKNIPVVTGKRSANSTPTLTNSEFTLPMAFDLNKSLGYRTAAIGKWHLADRYNGWMDHPNLTGFDHFSGLMGGGPEGYFSWIEVTNGKAVPKTGYTPVHKINHSIDWIKEQGDSPWFLWLAFNLPHEPWHLPLDELLPENRSGLDPKKDPGKNLREHFEAMIEAMDTEIGRLLDSIDPDVLDNTYVIFLGDNGTEKSVIGEPFSKFRGKGSLYQGGINVPLIISGPGVKKGERCKALVNSTDLFATIMEMAGISMKDTVPSDIELDSVSALPFLADPGKESMRDFAYADLFGERRGRPIDMFTIRNKTHKLITFKKGKKKGEELYNLIDDPYEKNNLLKGKLSDNDNGQYEMLKKQYTDLISGAGV